MIKIALTGSIGMGKSTVARMFEARGIPAFDADQVVRTLQAEDPMVIEAIRHRFPAAFDHGVIDRGLLASLVLERPQELAALEAIMHPAVQTARERFIARHRDAPALLFEIPLLFETGGEIAFDKVVVVSAPEAVQRQRVLARPGMTSSRLDAILQRQMPDGDKRARADFVVETGGDLSTTEAQVGAILACLGLAQGG